MPPRGARRRDVDRRAHADVGGPADVVKVRDRGDLAAFGDAAGPADVRQDQVDGLLAQPLLELPAGTSVSPAATGISSAAERDVSFDVLGRERVFEPRGRPGAEARPTARAVWLA